ncbi:DEAD/DEAH box helicase [Bacteroides caccae]|uniref:DEAD/DEAH box helicase n=1 Tax=Bacteroides caccae TaxID=47678 RepID=A0A6A1JU23_9BACE|nr:DEAD/DEAH box helicase [Bacteroides caccae]KAA5478110.1 DEAD/DEAH box helicase [Bacteroides caccae]KAA5488461.1 DEAD/DEAH box helicase [Bacteroides caccae]KAA5491311.1 DEAD/DEAH box helicase [Bacteroides caccae]KAA5502838.1 DEAD/DEAH box helicase [Bacteroides caccae]
MLNTEIFEECAQINALIENSNKAEARSMVINLLDKLRRDGNEYTPLINHVIREVGLFPYIDPKTALWEDQVVVEAFKANVGDEAPVTLHSAQSHVLKRLLLGDNIAVSAPTSFGKSFIVDAFIAIRQPENVVMIVPTIALADETRRRIEHKFSHKYKIITTTDATITERNIFIFPQERSFAYLDKLEKIDMLIVDEFYKASSMFDDDRSSSLLSAIIELGRISRQKYYLAPNIHKIADNVFTQGMQFMRLTDFKTVITKAAKIYEKRRNDENVDEFKKNYLVNILQNNTAKTLVYAGSYNNINKVSTILADNLPYKETSLLRDFNDWLKVNYGDSFSLCQLSERGIGIHNGKMHRSLSQIQVKLFECTEGLDTIISTSSIIEGVNTQAEQVIVWSNKNGSHKFDYFTYRNIIGRAGRMFKYFVGKVYLLEEPPVQENTTLTIDFPDEVAESLDSEDPGIEINQEQNNHIKEYEEFMMNALGAENFRQIRKLSIFKSCDPRILKSLIEKLKANPNWPRGYAALAATNTYNWREPVLDVVSLLGDNMAKLIKIAIWKMPDNWTRSIAEVYSELSDISYEDLFSAERYLSYNLCSTLSVINILKKSFDPTSPDISLFIGRAANAFLPKLVYQLEEYGLPRMISRKIQNSGLINLEDDSVEISEIIKQFNNIGREKVIQGLNNLLPFDKFIINYFYDGIC